MPPVRVSAAAVSSLCWVSPAASGRGALALDSHRLCSARSALPKPFSTGAPVSTGVCGSILQQSPTHLLCFCLGFSFFPFLFFPYKDRCGLHLRSCLPRGSRALPQPAGCTRCRLYPAVPLLPPLLDIPVLGSWPVPGLHLSHLGSSGLPGRQHAGIRHCCGAVLFVALCSLLFLCQWGPGGEW